jgi:hypothetical protein
VVAAVVALTFPPQKNWQQRRGTHLKEREAILRVFLFILLAALHKGIGTQHLRCAFAKALSMVIIVRSSIALTGTRLSVILIAVPMECA